MFSARPQEKNPQLTGKGFAQCHVWMNSPAGVLRWREAKVGGSAMRAWRRRRRGKMEMVSVTDACFCSL